MQRPAVPPQVYTTHLALIPTRNLTLTQAAAARLCAVCSLGLFDCGKGILPFVGELLLPLVDLRNYKKTQIKGVGVVCALGVSPLQRW